MQFKIATLDRDRLVTAVRQKIEDGLSASRTLQNRPVPGFPDTRELLKEVSYAASQVGTLPPQPPTFRARVGAVLVRIVQRMLFWYTPLIHRFQHLAVQALVTHNEQIQRLASDTVRLSEDLGKEQRRLLAQLADLQEWQRSTRGLFSATQDIVQSFDPRLQSQERRLTLLTKILEQKSPLAISPPSEEKQREFDAFYVSFEDSFRGPEQLVTDRLKVYLPYLAAAGAGSSDRPVLDVGTGRGEWLRLLRESNLSAQGVDSNSSMIEQCRRQDLSVTQSDVLLYLRGCQDASFGAVTAFHIVEHLPLDVVIETLKHVQRILKPGGIAIFETPNPANVLVGSKDFYHDPTHRNPIPAATLEFMFRFWGFAEVQALFLNPHDPANRLPDDGSVLTQKFNELFFGPQDYAVIGKKA